MRVTYIGAHTEVAVPLTFGGEAICEHGKSIDVADDLAVRLLEQEANWRLAPSELAKVTKAEKSAEEQAELRDAARAADDDDDTTTGSKPKEG